MSLPGHILGCEIQHTILRIDSNGTNKGHTARMAISETCKKKPRSKHVPRTFPFDIPSKQLYSPECALASSTLCLLASRFLPLSFHLVKPIFLRSMDTSSSHLILGLPLRLVAYSFPYSIFFGIAVSCILSICPSHRILWHLINLTIFSPLIMVSNSSFRRTRHNSFSFTSPYIFRKIFLSNIANVLSSSTVSVTFNIAPHIPNLKRRWRCISTFSYLPLYPRINTPWNHMHGGWVLP